jgi:hypothetical protein
MDAEQMFVALDADVLVDPYRIEGLLGGTGSKKDETIVLMQGGHRVLVKKPIDKVIKKLERVWS